MAWAVRLRSRHNGSVIILGSRHLSQEEAEAEAAEQCHRCNTVDVTPNAGPYRPWREQMQDQVCR